MVSYDNSLKKFLGGSKNYTIASTFEKAKSLKFELLFGDHQASTAHRGKGDGIVNAVDYHFSPGQVFGFASRSLGEDFQKFHYAFVLRACGPDEGGAIVPGITPGALVLVKAVGDTMCLRLTGILKKLQKGGVDLTQIGNDKWQRLGHLLETKINTDFFVGALVYEAQVG